MKTDVLIIGGGPGGCAAAMFLAKEGIQSIILEQEEFPRFHVGESMTGEAGAVLRRLGLEEKRLARNYPVKQRSTGFRHEQLVHPRGTTGRDLEFASISHLAGAAERFRRQDDRGSAKSRRQTRPRHSEKALRADDGRVRGVAMQRPDGSSEDLEAELVLDCSGRKGQ